MKKVLFTISLLPIFLHGDGDYSMDDANSVAKTATPYIEYHNRMAVFTPFHQVYERIETDAFYAGVEAWIVPIIGGDFSKALFEAELRFGYNLFYNSRDHLTPFAGIGSLINTYEKQSSLGMGYGVLGFLYDHEFNSIFNLGINVKGMIGGGSARKHHAWGNPIIGCDVALPITFRFGHKRHWDYRIELFNIYLHGAHASHDVFGFRNTVGYRF